MTIKYGEFKFGREQGFTGSAGVKSVRGYQRGGYAEGGMRSESTEEAKASRRVQDDAFAPAKQLNKSLKNLNRVRKETGYGLDDDAQGFARGGLRKMRIDKGRTKVVDTPSLGGVGAGQRKMPGQLEPMEPAGLSNPTPTGTPSPLSAVAASPNAMPGMKKGGKTHFAKGGPKKISLGDDPNQTLMEGVNPVTQKELLDLQASKPLRGRVPQKSSEDLFRPNEPDLLDLMKKRRGGKIKRR